MEYPFDRAFYRLAYPIFLRPTLRIGTEVDQVVDLSEAGVRFTAPIPSLFEPEQTVTGVLNLPVDELVEVEGRVVRRQGYQVALSLTRGVPFGIMLDQQQMLQQRVLGYR